MPACRRRPTRPGCPAPVVPLLLALTASVVIFSPAKAQTLSPAPLPQPEPAAIEVRLPPEAALWFSDVPTAQAGSRRQFVTPALLPGQAYAYDIAARWREAGAEVAWNESVIVRAGDRLVLDLPELLAARRGTRVEDFPKGRGEVVRHVVGHMSVTDFPEPANVARRPPGGMNVADFARLAPAGPPRGHMRLTEFAATPGRR